MCSVRMFLLSSASGFSHFHYAVGWCIDGQFKKSLQCRVDTINFHHSIPFSRIIC
jgi:hypothetical protein